MLNMSAGGSDGTDSGVISESALSPSFTSIGGRNLVSPFSANDSLLEEPIVLDELFSGFNAISSTVGGSSETHDADSSTTLCTSSELYLYQRINIII
jgi:hypothetical protein